MKNHLETNFSIFEKKSFKEKIKDMFMTTDSCVKYLMTVYNDNEKYINKLKKLIVDCSYVLDTLWSKDSIKVAIMVNKNDKVYPDYTSLSQWEKIENKVSKLTDNIICMIKPDFEHGIELSTEIDDYKRKDDISMSIKCYDKNIVLTVNLGNFVNKHAAIDNIADMITTNHYDIISQKIGSTNNVTFELKKQ